MANTPTESTNIADKSTLKNWFKTGLKPLQNHFWMWLDSYWHKSESIPITSIDGLANAIDGKASANHTHSEYATNDASSLSEENIAVWTDKLKNHSHDQYAKNDASSLTEENVLSWKEALDVSNLQLDDLAQVATSNDYNDLDNLPNSVFYKSISSAVAPPTLSELNALGTDRVDFPNIDRIYYKNGAKWTYIETTDV